jgi:asparagine synthase (glutamine-hydrolysing)
MSMLAGWTGEPSSTVSGAATLRHMLAAPWRTGDAGTHVNVGATGALGVVRDAKPASLFSDAELDVAVLGNIYWKDRELARLAATDGDAQAVARCYRRDQERFPAAMSGSFAVAVVDATRQRTLLAIDPMGIERLCYTLAADELVFASSLQGLRAHPAVKATVSRQAIFNYFYYHAIPAPQSVYDNMFKLEPGELLVYRDGRIKRSRHRHLRFQDHADTPLPQLVDEFHHVLQASVERPLAQFSDVGAFLSGGTDSSCVTAAMSAGSATARTFSIGFDAEGYDESRYARITADRFHTDHHHYYVTPHDVFESLPSVAAYYDEPFGNASAVPTYFCARLAREHGIKNLLAGDGGDEIFAGNARYVKQKIFAHWQHVPAPLRSGLIEPVVVRFPFAQRIATLRKLQSYIEQANIPLPDRLETYNFLHRDPLPEIFEADFLRAVDPGAPLQAQREVFAAADCDTSLNRMLFLDMKFTLADNDLRKVNGMCELAGMNVHFPLIDLEMVDFAARVPVDLKIKGHKLRWFFKHALKDTLAPETLTKSKHGFGLPFGVWLNDNADLHGLAVESLERFKQRGYLNPPYIDELWARHRAGHGSYYGTMIWICMMLEQWLEAHE